MELVISDGGRSKYFKKPDVRDCVCRAICNATGRDYKEIYDLINEEAGKERPSKKRKGVSTARNGVYKDTTKRVIEKRIGWKWHPLMNIGSGCKVHLNKEELPEGILILRLSKHLTCIKNGVMYDTFDCSRDGTRCVYGYWSKD